VGGILAIDYGEKKCGFASTDVLHIAREPLDALRSFPESQRYLRGLRAWVGFRQVGIDVERAERYAGTSQYTLSKLLGLALDGVFAFSVAPLRVASVLGFVVIAMSIGYSFYALWAKLFFDSSPRGFTGLIFAIVFLAGVQMLFLGILGEYVGRIYVETKRRPHYVVKRVSAAPPEHA
jgi:dolichol-phosphate mannosyltransferase